jgi:hypothetical protein
MQGKLNDMAVADLIQHTCMDGKTARLTLEHAGQQAMVFFDAGEAVHAVLGKAQGEEVIFEILAWNDGLFTLEAGVRPPSKTITRNWTGLILEGAHRFDEAQQATQTKQMEAPKMAKTRGERLADALSELLADSSDINGAAIVGHDGLVFSANVPQKTLNEEMVGAVSASIFGLGRRSADQLQRGSLVRAMIQGSNGNIIVSAINDDTLLVALTANDVNLGMAFMEIRSMSQSLAALL